MALTGVGKHSQLLTWGYNGSNQLGHPESRKPQPVSFKWKLFAPKLQSNSEHLSSIVKISSLACNKANTFVVRNQSSLYFCGQGDDSQTSYREMTFFKQLNAKIRLVSCSDDHMFAVSNDIVYAWGRNDYA
jgi:alpha-tubulin suppressor-like RCC1 family protein